MPAQGRDRIAPIDKAAGDRAAVVMAELEEGRNQTGRVAVGRAVAMHALHDIPAVVQSRRGGGDGVHFLPRVLPDVV